MENTSNINIRKKASFYFIYKFSLLNKTVLINFPLEVSKPVLKTYPKQESEGGGFFI